MFIKLHGIKNIRILINPDHVRAFQEITEDSKYAATLALGAKTLVQVDDKLISVKESIIQIENILKKAELIGGAT